MKTDLTVLSVIVKNEHDGDVQCANITDINRLRVSFRRSSLVVKQYASVNPVCYEVTARREWGSTDESFEIYNIPLAHCLHFREYFWYSGDEMKEQNQPINIDTDIGLICFTIYYCVSFHLPGSISE